MELQQLIAGPLIATIEADSLSSQRYLDYLMKIAFESYDPVTGRTGKIRMLTFNYQSQDAGGGRTECAAELVGKYESESEDASGRYACGIV